MSSLIKLTCWSVGSRRDRTFEVEIRSNDSIQQLKAALFEPSFQDVLLYKVDVALEDFYKTPVDDSFPANAPNSRLLSFSESLLEIFPEGPPRDNLHIVIQTGLQNKSDLIPSYLLEFHKKFWGKPLSENLTTIPPIEDDDYWAEKTTKLPVLLKGNRILEVPGKLKSREILIRVDYLRLHEFIKETYNSTDSPMVIVTGHPGIGKTVWIDYEMARCLGGKQSIVLYKMKEDRRFYYWFTESGVQIMHPDTLKLDHPIWCFIDSTEAETLPADVTEIAALYPIYVSPYNSRRWKNAGRQHRLWLMDPWALKELEAAFKIYPDQEEKYRKRFHEAGPIPQICFNYSDDEYEIYHDNQKLALDRIWARELELEDLILSPGTEASSKVFVIRRADSAPKGYELDLCSKFVLDSMTKKSLRRF